MNFLTHASTDWTNDLSATRYSPVNRIPLTHDDCCLLLGLYWNTERACHRLQCRFKSNATRTSFDFKSFLPTQPSEKAKVSRSLLNFYPLTTNSIDEDDDERSMSEKESDQEMESVLSPKLSFDKSDDDYLNRLAQWGSSNDRSKAKSSDEDEEEEEEKDDDAGRITTQEHMHLDSIALPTGTSSTDVEDLLVTFVHRPVKSEPMSYDDIDLIPSQLDGLTDVPTNLHLIQIQKNNQNEEVDETISKINSTFESSAMDLKNSVQSTKRKKRPSKKKSEGIIREDEPKLNTYRQMKLYDSNSFVEQKAIPRSRGNLRTSIAACSRKIPSERTVLNDQADQILQTRKHTPIKNKRRSTIVHTGKTLLDYFKVIPRSKDTDPTRHSTNTHHPIVSTQRSETYFNDCIVIGDDDDDDDDDATKMTGDRVCETKIGEVDDDVQETEQQCHSTWNTLHARERLLDHAVHSSSMRTKWLVNVELLLLEHITTCHKQHIHPSNEFYRDPLIKHEPIDHLSSYQLNPSLLSTIILNFLKMFIVRNSDRINRELMFHQYGITSHLCYLLLELPTYNHIPDINCSPCEEYSSILQILFDLLFDLLEYDLCDVMEKTTYRSSLINEDYFSEFMQPTTSRIEHSDGFFRIKMVINFIELLALHRRKCPNVNEFVFPIHEDRIFQWIEDIIRHVVRPVESLTDEKLSVSFNVMELCVLFAQKKEHRINQMARLLMELCQENAGFLNVFLLNENLLPDVRLLLINELIWKEFQIRMVSVDDLKEVFRRIEIVLRSADRSDSVSLLLSRSLFSTYADLILELKCSRFVLPIHFQQMTLTLRQQLDTMHSALVNLSHEACDCSGINRAVIFFRLLQSKWRQL